MQDNSSAVERRVRRYWYSDGIGELIGGAAFVLLGLYFALQEFLRADSPLAAMLQAGFVLLFIGGAWISRRLVNLLKTRLTYPRTGYVEYRTKGEGTRWRGLWAAGLAFLAAVFAVGFVRLFQLFDALVAFTGFIVALAFVALGAKSPGITRFYLFGVLSLALGAALSISGLPNGYSLGLFYGLVGLCACISGGLTLRRYLQQNPLPADGEPQNG